MPAPVQQLAAAASRPQRAVSLSASAPHASARSSAATAQQPRSSVPRQHCFGASLSRALPAFSIQRHRPKHSLIHRLKRNCHGPRPSFAPPAPTSDSDADDAAAKNGSAAPAFGAAIKQQQAGDSAQQPSTNGAEISAVQDMVTGASAPSGWQLVAFTIPTLAVWLVNPILSLVDTAVVGLQCSTDLAALAPGTMLIDYTSYIFTFLSVASTNMLAIAFAKKDKEGAGRIVSDALAIALSISVVLAVGLYACAPQALARIAGAKSTTLVEPATAYVRIRCLGLPAAFIIFITQAFFLAAIDPYTPLRAAVLAGGLNLAGDLWLVNGLGWGIAGAAWATAAAQVVTAAMLLWGIFRPLPSNCLVPGWVVPVRARRPSLAAVKHFLVYAGPIGGVLGIKTFLYSCLTMYATSIAPVSAAAHHVMLSVFWFFCTLGDSVSQAAQNFLPAVVGVPKDAERLGMRLLTTGVLIGIFNCVVSGSLVVYFPHLFTRSAEVVGVMLTLIPLFCSASIIHTTSMATEGIMLAGRDLMFLLWSYAANLGVALAMLAVFRKRQVGVVGVWSCLAAFQGIRLILNGWRLLLSKQSTLKRTTPLPASVALE